MSDDSSLKKTRKEGLEKAAREALERAEDLEEKDAKSPHEVGIAHAGVAGVRRETEGAAESEREAAVVADAKQEPGEVMTSTPHGKEDIEPKGKPTPPADSDDEAPLKTYGKIDEHDREGGAHRGPARAASEHADKPGKKPAPRRAAMYLAEYDSPGACMHAASKLRDAGYTRFDTHTPFPVHGMDRAMGLPDSHLGWIVLCGGLTGVAAAFTMIWWMNGVDYPLNIGGKPSGAASLPSMIPIMFELTILFSAFAAVFGMFHLNKIPQHHHTIFNSDRFRSFSDDRFFVSVEAADPKFKLERTRELLEKTHPGFIELVEEELP